MMIPFISIALSILAGWIRNPVGKVFLCALASALMTYFVFFEIFQGLAESQFELSLLLSFLSPTVAVVLIERLTHWLRLKRKGDVVSVTSTIAVFLATVFLAAALLFVTSPVAFPIMFEIYAMRAGQQYMDSLTDVEIQKWIDRSKDYLAHANPNEYPIGARPVPSDLKALKIVRIDLWPGTVIYVWAGGLDHTDLTVKEVDGNYEVIAEYNDQRRKVIWPRSANE